MRRSMGCSSTIRRMLRAGLQARSIRQLPSVCHYASSCSFHERTNRTHLHLSFVFSLSLSLSLPFKGTGIEKAMEALVQLALESKHTHSTMASMRSRRLARSPSVSNQDNSMDSENNNHKDNRYFAFRPNEELDLHARYAPKNGLVCFGLGCLFRSCISTAKDW